MCTPVSVRLSDSFDTAVAETWVTWVTKLGKRIVNHQVITHTAFWVGRTSPKEVMHNWACFEKLHAFSASWFFTLHRSYSRKKFPSKHLCRQENQLKYECNILRIIAFRQEGVKPLSKVSWKQKHIPHQLQEHASSCLRAFIQHTPLMLVVPRLKNKESAVAGSFCSFAETRRACCIIIKEQQNDGCLICFFTINSLSKNLFLSHAARCRRLTCIFLWWTDMLVTHEGNDSRYEIVQACEVFQANFIIATFMACESKQTPSKESCIHKFGQTSHRFNALLPKSAKPDDKMLWCTKRAASVPR